MTLPDSTFLPSKISHALGAAFLGLLLIAIPLLMSCAGPGCVMEKSQPVEKAAHLLFSPATPGESSVTHVHLSKDKRYELLFVSTPEGRSENHERSAPPPGALRLASFRMLRNSTTNRDAGWIHLLEWPAQEDRAGTFTVVDDDVVRLHPGRMYEWVRLTLEESYSARALMHRYHQVLTTVLRNYGGSYPHALLELPETNRTDHTHGTHRRLVEWASLADHNRLLADRTYQTQALPLRDQALQSQDSVLTIFVPSLPE